MDPNYVDTLHKLLEASISPSTENVKAATAQLNQLYYKNAECIPALASVIASSPNEAIRNLAAVEMRKRVKGKSGQMWISVPQNERDQIKQKFPELALSEANKLARNAIARVIATIASIEAEHNTWPGLIPLLIQTSLSSDVSHREIAIYMLYAVLDSVVDGFQTLFGELFQLFERLLQDPDSIEVRITTVKASSIIAQYIDRDDKAPLEMFQKLLPSIIHVIETCVNTGNEGGARQLFDVLETLLILEVPVLSKNIPELVNFLVQVGANRDLMLEMRILALNALNWTVQYKKSKIQNLQLAPAMLTGLMPITTELEPEDPDDDSTSRSCLRIIDGLCTHLPPSQVFPTLQTLIGKYLQSSNPADRRGAILALGIAVEGCSEYITPLLNEIWPVIDTGLRDPDPSVRKAACVGVSCMCEWLEEECAARHAVFVPIIMDLVNDPETQKAACTALDGLLEIMADSIDQYLPLLMERLGALLETAPLPVKAVITGAIGSAAHASKENFIPYFQPTMNVLQHFLILTGEGEETELRGITMDTVGTFAEAVGKDNFRPYFPDMMKQAFQGIEMGSARLRECSFLFFGVMAKLFGDEFAPYLPNVMPALIQSCQQPEAGEEFDVSAASTAFSTNNASTQAIAGDDEIVEEIDLDNLDIDKLSEVNSAIAVEKEIAADTFGTIFLATGASFLPYVEQCSLELVALLAHYYEGIRKAAVHSLLEIINAFHTLSNPAPWAPGAVVHTPLQENLKKLIDHILPQMLDLFETEDHKSVVAGMCVSLAETIEKIGPAFVEGRLEPICNIAVQVLEQKSFCQQDPDQDEEEEAPEDQAEYDAVLVSSAGDLVGALAKVLGPDFSPAFSTFFPLISKYAKKTRSLTDRASAIGCMAEIVSGMKSAITPYTQVLFELFCHSLTGTAQEAEVMSNAAFGVGLVLEQSSVDLSQQTLPLLQALRPLFDVPPDAPHAQLNAKDNACGAVARMIVRNIDAIPLDQVLPVIMNAIPCETDLNENKPVFQAIFHVFRSNQAALAPYMDHLLRVFARVLDPNQSELVAAETRAELITLIQALNQQDPVKIQAAGLAAFL